MDSRAVIGPGAAVRERSCPTNRPLLLNPERLVSFLIWDGVHVQVSVRWQTMDEELGENPTACWLRNSGRYQTSGITSIFMAYVK
jgi:hypothetical protein